MLHLTEGQLKRIIEQALESNHDYPEQQALESAKACSITNNLMQTELETIGALITQSTSIQL